MRKARILAAAAVASAAVLTIAGCSSNSSGSASSAASGKITGTVTLQTWSLTPTYTKYLNSVISAFEKKYPGTTVKLMDQPGANYSDKVLSQASTNTLPDVINLPPDFALPLAQKGLLADVSKADPQLKQTYVPGGIAAFQYNGLSGTFGFPWYLNTDLNWWNTSMLTSCGISTPPSTTQELFADAATMHSRCPNDYLISRVPGIGDFTNAGVQILNKAGTKFTFNTPAAAKVLDQYRTAYANKEMPPTVLDNDYLGNATLFTQGKVAWTTGGPTSLASFEQNNPSLKGKVAVTNSFDTPPLYVQGLSVSQKSKHLATAVALAEFVTNASNQNTFAKAANVVPSTTASASSPYFSKQDGTEATKARIMAFNELKTAQNLQPYVVNTAMSTYLTQQIGLAISGKETSQQALDNSVTKLNQMLAQQSK